jgi:hypothetical protein
MLAGCTLAGSKAVFARPMSRSPGAAVTEGEERADQHRDGADADADADGVPPTDPPGRRRSRGVAFALQGIGFAHRLLVRVGAQNLVDIEPACRALGHLV